MRTYIVRTKERAEGEYIVKAADEADVRHKLEHPGTDWDHVEQLDLLVFGRDIIDIVDVTRDAS